ncbi:MAG: hypothetical protein LBM71_01180 [Elusimicrobiota bacterium]|jgi:hypothetical protein|nr:hypothetical protein [Elusimicrobiota bacterium]
MEEIRTRLAKKLTFWEILSITFKVSLNSIIPALKLVLVYALFAIAFVLAGLIMFGNISSAPSIIYFILVVIFLSCFAVVITNAFVVAIYNVIVSAPNSTFANISDAFAVFIKMILAAILVSIASSVLQLPLSFTQNPLFTIPYTFLFFVAYIIIWPFILFYPFLIILRRSGVIDSFKKSIELTKNRWFYVATPIIGGYILITIFALLIIGALFMFWGVKVFSSLIALLIIICLGAYYTLYLFALPVVLFINVETLERIAKAGQKGNTQPSLGGAQGDSEETKEFTDLFRNMKEVNVSAETHDAEITLPSHHITREEALRNFNREEPVDFQAAQAGGVSGVSVDEYPTKGSAQMPTISVEPKDEHEHTRLTSIYGQDRED